MDTFDLKKIKPEEKFAEIEKFKKRLQESFVAFGELLSDIKRNEVFKFKGHKTFKDFIEKEYNLAASFAMKLIDTFELYSHEHDLDEETMKQIGFDRLNMIKPFVKDKDIVIAESWIEEARTLDTPDLREKIKIEKEKDKKKKKESVKDIFVKQHNEKMCTHLNCNIKELQFKMAVYFHEADMESIRIMIKDKQKYIESTGQLTETNE
jgi:hypothetical protein